MNHVSHCYSGHIRESCIESWNKFESCSYNLIPNDIRIYTALDCASSYRKMPTVLGP